MAEGRKHSQKVEEAIGKGLDAVDKHCKGMTPDDQRAYTQEVVNMLQKRLDAPIQGPAGDAAKAAAETEDEQEGEEEEE